MGQRWAAGRILQQVGLGQKWVAVKGLLLFRVGVSGKERCFHE